MTLQPNTEKFTYVQDDKLDCLTVITTLQEFIASNSLDLSIIQIALTFTDPFQYSLFYEEIDNIKKQFSSGKVNKSNTMKINASGIQKPPFQDQQLKQVNQKSQEILNINDIPQIENEILLKNSEQYIQQTQILEDIQKQHKQSTLSIQQLEEQRNLEEVEKIESIYKSQASRANSKSPVQNRSSLLTSSLRAQSQDHMGIIEQSSIILNNDSLVNSSNQKQYEELMSQLSQKDNKEDVVPHKYSSSNLSQICQDQDKEQEESKQQVCDQQDSYYHHQKYENKQENNSFQFKQSHLSIQSMQDNNKKSPKQINEKEEQKLDEQTFLSLSNSFQEKKQQQSTLYCNFNFQNDQDIAKKTHQKGNDLKIKETSTEVLSSNDEQQTAEDGANNILSSSIMQVIKNNELVYEDIVKTVKSSVLSKQLEYKISCQQIDSEKYKFNLDPLLVFLFKKDVKLQEFLNQNNFYLINDNQLSANYLLFKIKNNANIEFLINIFQCLQSFNKYTEQIGVPDAKAIASNNMFQENLVKDHNIFVFFDKIRRELVWFSLDKDETYIKTKSNEIEEAYQFEKLFLFRNFTNKGINEDELSKLELDHLNDIMIVRRAFYYDQLQMMRENYPEIIMSLQQRSFKVGKDKNLRLNFALQYEKKDFLQFQKMKKQLEDQCNKYLNFRIVMNSQKIYDTQMMKNNRNIYWFSKNTITVQCQITELSRIIGEMNTYQGIDYLEFLKEGELLSYQNKLFAVMLIQNGNKASSGIIKVNDIPAFLNLANIFG